ncbi:MAG: GNAT family N-acetyltransferase [Cyclobacteriaceae bacterium]|nr:GNAT family N-acetyltransferase [Cyclobacteriaceae bacterium]
MSGNISLRPIRYEDKERLAKLADNKKIWKNLRDMFPHPYAMADAEKFIDSIKLQEQQVTFAIDYKHQFVGVIGITSQSDVYRKGAEIGYWIGEPYWNKGISSRALLLATEYGFEELNLERLYAGVFAFNEPSKRVLEKCGYKLEGISRNAVFKNGKLVDEFRYAKLKME